ncbi:hypothetical protein J19TS2_19000 [Cohnella xylanilytica]|uniref:hypothetical protein n=1 Tax=Cohnella xylanilytica TaxID=557555 RepID=UPI001B007985|nr:hypothetical protein [Cohnella xylanilytica]GIO12345.1 hypothetical protein J19TS2_19000 [Cohnella xylanilytica]
MLLSISESVAKTAAVGGQLFADKLSVFGFFAFCLLFVGFCLIAPAHLYEKYYKKVDDAPDATVNPDHPQRTDPAA